MDKQYDIIIILGGGIDSQRRLPLRVIKRLEHTHQLYRKGVSNLLLMSGKGIKNYSFSEAGVMKQHLVKKGIPEHNILTEDLSTDTIENAYFSRVVHIDPMRAKKILIVTSEFHIKRAKSLFKWVFGPSYKLSFKSVQDECISKKTLQKRKIIEEKLHNYYKKNFYTNIKAGDLFAVHSLLFNTEDKLAKAFILFIKELHLKKDKSALY
ncbi:MAG: YdcF family protein [Nanoarchaeota archaeon]|nr:YdcF family protein [Nanoarchaeota archaeon]